MAKTTNTDLLSSLEETASLPPVHHLPQWQRFEAENIVPAATALLDEVEAAFDELEGAVEGTWSGLMMPLERMQIRLGVLLGTVGHLLSVTYSDALQAAYDEVRPRYVAFTNRMAQSRAVYDGMVTIRNGAEFAEFDAARQRVLTESIRAMERSGVHLQGEAKARYEEIQQRLSALSNDFSTNLVREEKDSRIKVGDAAQVADVPAPVLAAAAEQAKEDGETDASAENGPWHFVVNGVNYMAVMQQGSSAGLREDFYRAFRARGTGEDFDNRPILEEILRLRQEEAQLVGFDHYAALSIDAKMAGSVEDVWSLLGELEKAARPAAEAELAALGAYAAEHGIAEALSPWDVPYVSERLREEQYDYDSEALREYLQMPKVLAGLFELTERLYGLGIREVAADSVPVWDDSVSFYEVTSGSEVIAGFYVDPYARPGEKRGGAWMNTVVGRNRSLAGPGQSSSLPVALFVMNGRPPEAGKPALMSLDEVRTLFHEFGHATQHMFTDVEEGGASGLNLVEWDAVELASQFNEYWMEHKPFLKKMTEHVETGEPLDDGTIDRIIASKNFLIGNGTLRQLQFGKADLALHQRYGLPGGNDAATPFEMEQQIARETVVAPMLEDETQLPAFGHLFAGGYAAGYYSYKWAEVLAADAFAAFQEVGLDDEAAVADVADRFRRTVLGLGGSLPAAEVYRQFRGRDATADALLVDQGLKAENRSAGGV
jgi:oligopeptidase A